MRAVARESGDRIEKEEGGIFGASRSVERLKGFTGAGGSDPEVASGASWRVAAACGELGLGSCVYRGLFGRAINKPSSSEPDRLKLELDRNLNPSLRSGRCSRAQAWLDKSS